MAEFRDPNTRYYCLEFTCDGAMREQPREANESTRTLICEKCGRLIGMSKDVFRAIPDDLVMPDTEQSR